MAVKRSSVHGQLIEEKQVALPHLSPYSGERAGTDVTYIRICIRHCLAKVRYHFDTLRCNRSLSLYGSLLQTCLKGIALLSRKLAAIRRYVRHLARICLFGDFGVRAFLAWLVNSLKPQPRAETAMAETKHEPLFTFGIIADIQYADIDDGYNFHRTRKRYYRSGLTLLSRANRSWLEEKVPPQFVLQLGDVIDGFNKQHEASTRALQTVLDEFRNGPAEIHHVWGNHEFYNFSRSALLASPLNSTPKDDDVRDDVTAHDFYAYHFSPTPKFRFVVLDAYDLSLIGREQSSEKYKQAFKLLKEHNPNKDLNQPGGCSQLSGRFVKFNGGFSQEQLDWLEGVLTSSDEKEERVTIVSHIPVHPFSSDCICIAYNFDKMLAVLNSHKSVVCFMAGHTHDGGYYNDALSGVHHITVDGVVETPPDTDAFGTVYVYEDMMVLKGKGRVESRVLRYK